jgi:two-component system, NarL family, sensor histidine kinase UhpB
MPLLLSWTAVCLMCSRRFLRGVCCIFVLFSLGLGTSWAQNSSSLMVMTQALAVASSDDQFPQGQVSTLVTLPDDWSETQTRYSGWVWYRATFTKPKDTKPGALLGLYIRRVCSTFDVQINGQSLFKAGHLVEPVTRNCHYPQLVTIPASLLRDQGNQLDLRVMGYALQRVVERQHAGGLSELVIGPYEELAPIHARQLFWNVKLVQAVNLGLAILGIFMVALGWLNRREVHLSYFGWASVGWALLSMHSWLQVTPMENAHVEFAACVAAAPIAFLVVQFLLSHVRLRSRVGEQIMLAQCLLLPASLVFAGPSELFAMASYWYAILAIEITVAMAVYLYTSWRLHDRWRFWVMAITLPSVSLIVLLGMAVQHQVVRIGNLHVLEMILPMLMIDVGVLLLVEFAQALATAEAGRSTLQAHVAEITAEIENNFAQLAELRVEQVTEKERKRIAGDLHDDLGAKLLTIVHISESERISTLAREALEEMRLSVRGLTGKPVRLVDALADWRAETISRLGQANVDADWRNLAEDAEQVLPARCYVQTTRILREAVSNIIKHSGASLCRVRCEVHNRNFELTIQDNGRGISMEFDGKLDRGHGMSSMKHRAKQMQGQCLLESGPPGTGTAVRLSLPL